MIHILLISKNMLYSKHNIGGNMDILQRIKDVREARKISVYELAKKSSRFFNKFYQNLYIF